MWVSAANAGAAPPIGMAQSIAAAIAALNDGAIADLTSQAGTRGKCRPSDRRFNKEVPQRASRTEVQRARSSPRLTVSAADLSNVGTALPLSRYGGDGIPEGRHLQRRETMRKFL